MTAVWIILLILGLVGIGITIHYGKKFRDERKKGDTELVGHPCKILQGLAGS